MKKNKASQSYKDAGVNIEAGNALISKIAPLAQATHRKGVASGLGGFGGIFDLSECGFKDPLLIATNDGVGTKVKIAIAMGNQKSIGIDLVAMCVNDLVVQGAEPLFFLDYFATAQLEIDEAKEIIGGIAEGCKLSGCALLGGETAEMPGIYAKGDYDLAGFAVGAVERDKLLPRQDIAEGDIILGLASDGFHSNGFSLLRHLIEQNGIALSAPCPYDKNKSFGEALLTPTRIYVKALSQALETNDIKALAHITGGGLLENLPRILPQELAAHISLSSWELPQAFQWARQIGNISQAEMLRVFNCGIGMVVITDADRADSLRAKLQDCGETIYCLGRIEKRTQTAVHIEGKWQ